MYKIFILAVLLLPAPVYGAELWCMPDTVCRTNGNCYANTDEESSLRIHDMKAAKTTMRSHAETIAMVRTKAGTAVEWRGTNENGGIEYVIWSKKTGAFTYTVAQPDGALRKATGTCEVQ
jgi:hypothetical protein